MTTPSIGQLLDSTVPMARTLKLEYLETTPERAVLRLPDQPEYHNHVGGPHGRRDVHPRRVGERLHRAGRLR